MYNTHDTALFKHAFMGGRVWTVPVLVGAAETREDHVAEAAGSVQFGLTLGPFNGPLQSSTEETLRKRTDSELICMTTDNKPKEFIIWIA